MLSSAFCFAQDCPNHEGVLTPEETLDHAFQPPDGDILHRIRFSPVGCDGPCPTVLMLPPDIFKLEYEDHGVKSEGWATYDLEQAGFLVFQVEHRLAPPGALFGQTLNIGSTGRPPDQTDDIKRQILAALADTEHCNGSIYLVGGSAGGTLALWCALDSATGAVPGWDNIARSHIKAVVSLSGPTDFCNLDHTIPDDAATKFLNDLDNYVGIADGTTCEDDMTQKLANASPISLVAGSTSCPPVRLYATMGDPVPYEQATAMYQALFTKYGLTLDLYEYTMTYEYGANNSHAYNYWHSSNDAIGSDGRCVSQQVIDFLKSYP